MSIEDKSRKAVIEIIFELNYMNGFDHWWDQIGAEDKKKIVKTLSKIVAKVFSK